MSPGPKWLNSLEVVVGGEGFAVEGLFLLAMKSTVKPSSVRAIPVRCTRPSRWLIMLDLPEEWLPSRG